ncbi:EAL domain-containing protein [Vibrio renipiscarius]|uniref:EAL domain-containing protein n=1 Tax=Vibrio renipiscarius TaxID=1461322 RepID=UPI00069CAD1B|nr:EAL domain-containing protein [Vibrio renipiscarius]
MACKFIARKNGVFVTKESEFAVLDFLLQPICEPENTSTMYYEILSRVTSQSGEQFDSQDFFLNVGDEFIKNICLQQLKYAKRLQIREVISTNVTMACLEDGFFIDSLLSFESVKFALEINELNCNTSSIQILKNIDKLQRKGIMIWLDDYHSNNEQANLSLGNIQWDYIKIDKSFLLYNSDDSMAAKSLSYVLTPFVKRGLIYEGVETYEQHKIIRSTGSLAQGYYYRRPDKWSNLKQDTKNEHSEKKYSII